MSRRAAPRGSLAVQVAAIEDDFPGWHAWPSSAGRCWATRTGSRRRPPGAGADWAMTVDGDTPDQLREAIAAQDRDDPG